MPDECGVASAVAIPVHLKRQFTKRMVNKPAHLLNAPTSPRPHLRYAVVEDRDTVRLCPARDPPIKAGIVDQDDRIRPMVAKVAIGLASEIPKLMNIEQ